jgi:hypothetical protein
MTTFALKNLKTFKAHEGMPGYSVTLYIDGKMACDIFEDCCGGGLQYTWHDRTLQKVLDDHCKTLPPEKSYGLSMTADLFIDELVNALQDEREDKKMVKKFAVKLHFKSPASHKKAGEYGISPYPPTPATKEFFRKKYPDIIFLDEHPADWRKIVGG